MKKIVNSTHFEGYLFSHDLQVKVSGEQSKNPGTEFISGSIQVMTDDAGLNVVPVNYRYVVAKTKAGKDNLTFKTLMTIINSEGKTFQEAGAAGALKVKVDTALGLNDFYNNEGELITYKLNDGGFVHIVPQFGSDRNSFNVDMLITAIKVKDADAERGTDDMVIVSGATFNFMGSLLPVDLVVRTVGGMKFFENLDASPSEPLFMKVWGHVTSSTVETQTVEESAFGEASVKTSTRNIREWEITGASTEPYAFDDEATITAKELQDAAAARQTYLAEVKTRHDAYMASKGTTSAAAPAAAASGAPQAAAADFVF